MSGNSSAGRASAFQAEGRRFESGFPLQTIGAEDGGRTNERLRRGLVGWGRGEYKRLAHVAQSAEHFLGKEEVTGSNPVMGSTSVA